MRIIKSLLDNEYPYIGIEQTREIVRAMILLDDGRFLFHHLEGDDIFGHRDYFETPGGGKEKGEDNLSALARECKEETGYEIVCLSPIGIIEDYYNLLKRKNINHYYLVKAIGEKKETHFASKGDELIKETLAFSLEEAEEGYRKKATTPIARLLMARELPIIEATKFILLSHPFSCRQSWK